MKKLLLKLSIIAPLGATILSTISCSTKEDILTSSNLNNQLIDDAIEKTSGSNKENISVFFIIWNGQIQNLQTIWEIMLQKQLQPDKEVYLYLGADAFDPKVYDYATMLGNNQNGKSVFQKHYGSIENGARYGVTDKEIENIYSDLGIKHGSKQLDLYMGEEVKNQINWINESKGFTEGIINSIEYIDSINFITDGTYNFLTNDYTKTYIKSRTKGQLKQGFDLWKDIFNGKKKKVDFISEGKTMHGQENYRPVEKINSFENLDEMLPLLSYNDNFVNENKSFKVKSFTMDIDPYLNNPTNKNYWGQRGLGLYSAWNLLSKDNQEKFVKFYNADSADINEVVENSQGHENYIYAGGIINGTEETTNEQYNILKNMINEKIVKNDNKGNIILKVHPKSTDDAISKLVKKLNKEFEPTMGRDILMNLKQSVIMEVYILAGIIKNNENTKYHFSVNGTSTTVLGFYAANQIEMIDEFIFPNENALNQYKLYYGEDSNIIDWDKAVKSWETN